MCSQIELHRVFTALEFCLVPPSILDIKAVASMVCSWVVGLRRALHRSSLAMLQSHSLMCSGSLDRVLLAERGFSKLGYVYIGPCPVVKMSCCEPRHLKGGKVKAPHCWPSHQMESQGQCMSCVYWFMKPGSQVVVRCEWQTWRIP